jgi:2-polyprenyl-6-methoxyphenol hydroxylase-like FAD-dependent oxidoreductase
MNLGLRDGISLGPVIAAALTAGLSPESDEKVHAHMTVRRERAIDVINVAKNMAGTMGMSPAVQAKFAWLPIEMHTIRDWIFWVLGKSHWVRESLAYKISGLGSP